MSYDEILKVEGLSAFYEPRKFGFNNKKIDVLNDVSFNIRSREFFGLVGESGCGKSTLCKAILGLIDFQGKITINNMNREKGKYREMARSVQAVFQDPMSALNPKKTIGFILEEPLKIHKIGTKEERQRRVDEVLEFLGLDSSYRNRYPNELSGGQRQRVCIGCSIILNPKLIIADEPISSLDVSVGAQILNLFQKLHDSFDLSVLFVSHNLNLVYYLCDRITVMYKGSIIEMGDAKDVYYNPLHPYTQLLLSATARFDGEKLITDMTKKTPVEDVTAGRCNYYSYCRKAKDDCRKLKNVLINVAGTSENPHYVSCPYYYQFY